MIDFEGDAPAPGDKLTQVKALADLLVAAETNVTACEAQFTQAKETRRRIQEDDLPELMRELGLKEVALEDGSKVAVVDEVSCAITVERRPAAHAWLTSHGFGGLIKSAITIEFGRDEFEKAKTYVAEIEQLTEHRAELDEAVHPATLKAFLKEQLEAGTPLPTELFGMRAYSKAKLTMPKAKVSRKK